MVPGQDSYRWPSSSQQLNTETVTTQGKKEALIVAHSLEDLNFHGGAGMTAGA